MGYSTCSLANYIHIRVQC